MTAPPEPGPTGFPLTAACLVALTVVAVIRKGAFHSGDAAAIGACSLVLLALELAVAADRAAWMATAALTALAAWWLAVAGAHDQWYSFLPLGASIVAFATSFVVMRRLHGEDRATGGLMLAVIGAAAATVGLVAVAFRLFPFAARAQNTWRVTTPLTYANAAGLLIAMCLLVSLGLGRRAPLRQALVCLCAAALVGTQSRGAVVALVAGAAFVPWESWRNALPSLCAGVLAGLAVVATSPADVPTATSGPVVVTVVAVAVAFSATAGGSVLVWPRRLRRAAAAAIAVALAGAAVATRHTIVGRLTLADRSPEWSAAGRQWASHVLFGAGPDRPLLIDGLTRTFAAFAHNEYLQVLAGAGLVGAALLLLAAGAVAKAIRRCDALASCSTGAVVAFAVAGFFDYDWHLPAVALIGGWVAALAAPRDGRLPSSP